MYDESCDFYCFDTIYCQNDFILISSCYLPYSKIRPVFDFARTEFDATDYPEAKPVRSLVHPEMFRLKVNNINNSIYYKESEQTDNPKG